MANEKVTQQTIADLKLALKENAEFYHASAINAAHDSIGALLRARAQERTELAQQLDSAQPDGAQPDGVQPDGVQPSDDADATLASQGDSLGASLRRGFTTVTAALTIEPTLTDRYLVLECQKADERLLAQYEAALKDADLPSWLRSRITEQQAQIQATYTFTGTRFKRQTSNVVLGLFAQQADLQEVMATLRALGFTDEQLTVVTTEQLVDKVLGDRKAELSTSSAGVAALGGSLVGGLLGLIAGIGILALPGVGAVVALAAATTVIGSTAVGASIGATQGAFLGMLIGWGVAEENTQRYTVGVQRGEFLLVVYAAEEQTQQVATLMRSHNGSDVEVRSDEQLNGNSDTADAPPAEPVVQPTSQGKTSA
jgi:uncharacterized protein (TIGR02284 family)